MTTISKLYVLTVRDNAMHFLDHSVTFKSSPLSSERLVLAKCGELKRKYTEANDLAGSLKIPRRNEAAQLCYDFLTSA